MNKKYPTTDHTFLALENLEAEKRFVTFDAIFNEVKRIRISNGQIPEDKNTKGRVRRSLVYNKQTSLLRNTVQGNELSIGLKYPDYIVKPEKQIALRSNGMIDRSIDVESNRFMLVKIA